MPPEALNTPTGEKQDGISNQNLNGTEIQSTSIDVKKAEKTAQEDLKKSQKEASLEIMQQLQEIQKELEEDLSLGDIRREKRKLEREVKKMSKTGKALENLNKVTFKKALLTLDIEDRKNFNTYLKKVINKEIDPAIEKFQPQNEESFVGLLQQMPYLSGYVKFTRARLSNGEKISVGIVNPAVASQVEAGGYSGTSTPEKKNFREGGLIGSLNGLIDQTKMTPQQKQFRNGTSKLLVMGGAVFVGWKMLSSAFKLITNKDERKNGANWARLALPLGLTFAANATSGGSLMDIFKGGKLSEKLSDWMGLATGKISEAKNEFKDTYSKGFMSAGALFSGLSVGEVKKVLEKGTDGKIKISDSGYQALKQAHESRPDDEKSKLALQYLNKGSADDNLANLGLNAIFGDYDKLMQQDDAAQFDKLYAENIKRFSDINQYIEKNKYTTVNVDDFKDEITSYIREGKPTLEELDKMGAFLETPVEITKNLNLNKIEAIKGIIEKKGKVDVKIGSESAKLLKGATTGEVLVQSKSENITKINLDLPSIIGLGDGQDRVFVDKNDNPDIYSTILYANKFNGLKNRYKNRNVAAGDVPFKFENGKIYFNESKTGTTEINKVEVMDDGIILGLMTDFPDVFKGQEHQIVNYLNREITLQNQSLEDVIKEFNYKNIEIQLEGNKLKSHGEVTTIDIQNKKIIGLDDTNGTGPNRRFENYSDLVGGANLINFFKKFLRNRPAQSTENPIYIGLDGNIAFNDRTMYEEINSYANRGANGFGDSDLVQSGDTTFWKENTFKTISPTLYAHRRDFVEYLNKNGTFSEKVTENTDYNGLKEKITNLNNGDKLEINLKGEKTILTKINGTSEVNVESPEGKTTLINLDTVSIRSLGYLQGGVYMDRPFKDKEGKNSYYELLVTAQTLNNIKNKYEGRIYGLGADAFTYSESDKKIYFNESKEGGGGFKSIAMDDGIVGGFMSQFPESFKGQEQQIANYLNAEVNVSPEDMDRVLQYFKSKNMTLNLIVGATVEVDSHGFKTQIDLTTKKIAGLDMQFKNYLELIGAANLINAIKKVLKSKTPKSKEGLYIGMDGAIAFNDRTILQEMLTYVNGEGRLHGYGDTDIVQGGDLAFWRENTLKSALPTVYSHREEFVEYLNNLPGLHNPYEDPEVKKLNDTKAKIEKVLNTAMRTTITFAGGGMVYDENTKELTITAINESNICNDQLVDKNEGNLVNLENIFPRYNIIDSEHVKKIILPNLNLEPGKSVSVRYLKQLLKFNPEKIELGPDFAANRKMVEFVAKKYDEGKFMKETNSNIDMNGIIMLNYIYDNGYDFNRLFNGEDDSRVDFAMRVMELLAGHTVVVDPDGKSIVQLPNPGVKVPIKLPANDDPIMKIFRVGRGENVDFGLDKNHGFRNWRKSRNNIDIMNQIIENIVRYANHPQPNVPYISI